MNFSYKLSIISAILPFLTGLGVYAAWLVTDNPNLMFMGVLLLPLCMLFFIIGCISLFFSARALKKSGDPQRGRKILLALACLLINFPAAIGIMIHADYRSSFFDIRVVNQTRQTLNDITIIDPQGNAQTLPVTLPDETAAHDLSLRGEGSVRYRMTLAGEAREGVLIGYITSDLRPQGATITVQANGQIEISEK
jgi:multisubunit Na+/H+ antiporter MnhB subunit